MSEDGGDRSSEMAPANVRTAARAYAWEWFRYHAGQRQAVFRFYLLVSGAILTAFFLAIDSREPLLSDYARWIGGFLIAVSFLFWRLDERSVQLVKIAEDYLKEEENELARDLMMLRTRPADQMSELTQRQVGAASTKIKLVHRADDKSETPCIFQPVRSFKWIYRWIFTLLALLGLGIMYFGVHSGIERSQAHQPHQTSIIMRAIFGD